MNNIFVSIDVGLHNLATVIEENNKIIFTESKNLTNKDVVDNSVLISLTNYLDCIDLLKQSNVVLIEKQLGTKNHKAKRLENHIHSYFLIKYPNINVVLFPSSNKTKVLDAPKKMTKYQRKKWSVEKTKELLLKRGDQENYDKIFSKKKADDESDAFLQLQAYKILKKISNVETVGGENIKID